MTWYFLGGSREGRVLWGEGLSPMGEGSSPSGGGVSAQGEGSSSGRGRGPRVLVLRQQ